VTAVDGFEIAELQCGLEVKVQAVETSAFRHGTPKLSLGKIAIVS
jgi:hypothetical protein